MYRLCNPIYSRTLLHIPFTALYRLCNPIYPCALLHLPSTPLYRLCTPICPLPFYIYPLLPCIVFVLPYQARTLLHIPSALMYCSCTLIYPFLHFAFTFFNSLLIIPLMNLQDNGLGNSSVKPRSKRSYHHSHSKKLSIKDLALELAKKHVSALEPR